jgi:beta-galactosidase
VRIDNIELINDTTVLIKGNFHLNSDVVQSILSVDFAWEINGEGTVKCDISAQKNGSLPWLPRLGVRLFLKKEYESAEYTAFGPDDNYVDKCQSSYFGKFKNNITDMFEDYIFPQENGSHKDCENLKISNGKEEIEFLSYDKPFTFSALHYTSEELTAANHNFELTPGNDTVVCIDYMQSGVGSSSCGPILDEKYRLNESLMQYSFLINIK